MRVFVTGASGHIGSALIPELQGAGHEVVALARSDESAAKLAAVGVEVRRGDLGDLDIISKAAADADGVIHLAYRRDLMHTGDVAGVITANQNVIEAAGAAPVVHSTLDTQGFTPALIGIARDKGVAAYVGDGANRWPAVHTLDAARLFRLALESAPAGSRLHGVAEEGVPFREFAEAIGRNLGLPTASIPAEDAAEHFGFLAMFAAADNPTSSALTRQWLGWEPTHPGLIADLDGGHYFA